MSEKISSEHDLYVDYSAILRQESPWQPGAIKLADMSTWNYVEPDAQVTVRRGHLLIQVTPFTRRHDSIQTLDNSKHLYFSTVTYPSEIKHETAYEVTMSVRGINTNEGEIFDGFAAFHLLDTSSGIAADFFAGNDSIAVAYSKPKHAGTAMHPAAERKYLAVFKNTEVSTTPDQAHNYVIAYNPEASRLTWKVDGMLVAEEKEVPVRVKSFRLGLGVMTAKTITDGRSVSNHGQGIIGHWSPVRIFRQGR